MDSSEPSLHSHQEIHFNGIKKQLWRRCSRLAPFPYVDPSLVITEASGGTLHNVGGENTFPICSPIVHQSSTSTAVKPCPSSYHHRDPALASSTDHSLFILSRTAISIPCLAFCEKLANLTSRCPFRVSSMKINLSCTPSRLHV